MSIRVAVPSPARFTPRMRARVGVTGNFGIATKLNGWMTANLLFNDRYYSQPVLGNKNNDILFTTGLGFTFGAKAT
jgi:hypothetical protein